MFFLDFEKFCIQLYKKYSQFFFKILIIYALGASVFGNAKQLTKSLYTGQIQETFTQPLYKYMLSPNGLSDDASNKFGADFLCLYSAAKNYLKTGIMYDLNADPWKRPAMTFPPHLIFLMSKLTSNLNFPKSVLFSNYFQIIVFLVIVFYYLKSTSTSLFEKWLGNALILFLIFCTSVGMTWFERGQTDLFTASAVLLLMKGIRDEYKIDFILAGIFLSLKWSGIPYFVFFSLIYLALRRNSKAFINIFLAAIIPFLFLIPFGSNSAEYLYQIRIAEINAYPVGISLASFYPRLIAKLLPFFQTYLFIQLIKNKNLSSELLGNVELVFIMFFSYVCCAFGTYAFEYRTVCLLFLIPIFWGRYFVFSKIKFQEYTYFYIFIFSVFLFYVFKIETFFVYLNRLLGYKRGLVIFNSLTFMLFYLHLKYTPKWNKIIDSFWEPIRTKKYGK